MAREIDKFRKPDRSCDLTQDYAFGWLTSKQRESYEAHLDACLKCRSEVADYGKLMADSLLPASVAQGSRGRFMLRLRSQPSQSDSIVFSAPGVLAMRSHNMEWADAGLPGVRIKVLAQDKTRGYHTSLVKLDPGVRYPSHRHAAIEEVFILEGDLQFPAGTLLAGDYCRAESGTIHSPSHTQYGCTLLISTSMADEMLA